MMEQQKKGYEVTIRNLRAGMSEEIELLTQMYSNSARDLLISSKDHKELKHKFAEYSQKSDAYIKDRETKLKEMENEVKRLNEEYSSFDIRFSKKKKEAEQLKQQL